MAVPALSDSYRQGAVIAGKYRLMKRIGSGAMGAVWSAVNTSTNGQVALKLIERSEPELRQRLIREAHACASIHHKNVVQVHDVGETESEDPFLVMELLRGQTLASLLRERRRLPPDEAALLGRDIARGLAAAHAQGIIHRDLKPANIFLHEQPGEPAPVVKVLDFGVSKNLTLSDGLHTRAGGAVGSPMYMSPEQARAERDIDTRADVWSLGVVLYEMLTGERPFSGETAEVVFKITHGEIPRVSRRLRRIDPDLDRIVDGCLTRDRDQRTPTAEAVAAQLERHTLPAPRGELPSLMEPGLADALPASSAAASSSGSARLSPGMGSTGLAGASPGLGSVGLAPSSGSYAALSRSGSRPLEASTSTTGVNVEEDAATQPLRPSHVAPGAQVALAGATPAGAQAPASDDEDAMYGPRGTVRIDPTAVDAAIRTHKASQTRPGRGTMPMLEAPRPPPRAAIGATQPLAPVVPPPPAAAPAVAPSPAQPTTRSRKVPLWLLLAAAVLLLLVLGAVVWLWLRTGNDQGSQPAGSSTGPTAASSAPAAPPASGAPAAASVDAPSIRSAQAPANAPEAPASAASSAPGPSATSTAPGPSAQPAATTSMKQDPPRAPTKAVMPTTPPPPKKCTSKFGIGCK